MLSGTTHPRNFSASARVAALAFLPPLLLVPISARSYASQGATAPAGVCSPLVTGAEIPPVSKGGQALARARALARCGAYGKAAAFYRAYLRLNPVDAGVWCELGEALDRTGDWRNAASAFTSALALPPQGWPRVAAELGLAHAEARLGSYDAALASYNLVLAHSPLNYDALQGKAFVLYWRHDFASAAGIFEQLARENPRDPENAAALRSIHQALDAERWAAMRPSPKATPQAWVGYEMSYLADHPEDRANDEAALKRLARAEAELGMYGSAVRDDQHALRLDPADSDAQQHLGLELAWSRGYDASIEAYDELLRRHPGDRATLEDLERVDEWSGRLKDALNAEQRLAVLYPQDFVYQKNIVRLELALKQDAEARRTLSALIHERPGESWPFVEMARLEMQQGHLTDALSYYDSALAIDFTQPDALYGEARIYYFLADPDRAYPFANRLVTERPKDFDALLLCARIERARGDAKDALALVRRAALLNPASTEVKNLVAATENDYKVAVHTSSTYARELGFQVFAPDYPARPVEDLNAYSSAVRTDFSVLPRSDSYVLVATMPSNSPVASVGGAVAPSEVLYGQTTRISSLLTLRGGVGAERLGPGAMIDVSTSPFERPVPAPRPGIIPVGYFGLSFFPAKRLAVNFTASRAAIAYTPTSVQFAVMDTQLGAGLSYNFSARTRLAASYSHDFVSSAASYQTLFFPLAFHPFGISFLAKGGSDHGNSLTATFDRDLLRTERFSLDLGYAGQAFEYAGERHGVWMGFYNPELYQAHYLTAHTQGVVAGPLRFGFTAEIGAQQAHVPASLAPFARAVQLKPSVSVRVSRRLGVTLGYVHYSFSQSLGAVRGNALEMETDWRF